ncbi:class I adenylate-forming enzyme family protein [Pseudorhodobacter sp.]|uniref:class I adenylate-forming enzyme family protein n=1 Tax=Pseudorhodobacter sp. TaxID=1934400 RepID=UPI0026478778|nr:class I adenylate-forming enzyme family protein [Pseudorhodobacter sp.]MDN5787601.1 acyl--CoA ligase [Pseudorhodobacter sp.]
MSFLDALAHVDPERRAIVTAAQTVRFADLVQAARGLAPALTGRHLVLNHPDLVQAVTLLAAADGQAATVALMSPQHAPQVLAPLMAELAPDLVLSLQGVALAAAGLQSAIAGDFAEIAVLLPPAPTQTAQDTAWVLTTSGTTSTPKLVQHSLSSLTRTTRSDTARGRGQVWGMVYDYTRFAGLQLVLQSLLSGACLVLPPQDVALDVQLQFLAQHGCTHLSATPTMWRKILMSPQGGSLPLRQITLGGEIADDTILASLARAYPTARLSHIFASTEAGVGFSVTDGKAGFPATYLTDPPAGIGLRIAEGRLWVRNDQVGAAYLDGRGAVSQDGWVDTGDMVEERDARVFFKGRESGVINVGGNKVHPEEVERVLLSHPMVQMARVYGKANPIMGALVMADIVPVADAPDTIRQEVTAYLRARLEKHMVPASLRLTNGFDVNAAGKITREG